MNLRGFVAVSCLAWTLGAASAQAQLSATTQGQTRGWYVGIEGGWSDLQNFSAAGSTAHLRFSTRPDAGFVSGVDGGYNFGRVRFEGEIAFREHQVGAMTVTNGGISFPALTGKSNIPGGNVGATSFMINAMADIMRSSVWTPYIGAGVGGVRLAENSFSVAHTNFVNKSDVQLAYQGIAGVRYQLAEHVSLNLDYRYFAATDPDFKDLKGFPFTAAYATHNVLLGIAYHFGAPMPPMQAARAPASVPTPAAAAAAAEAPPAHARTFMVFFDFNQSTITPAGARVIEEAAASFKQSGSARVQLAGYTDLAGSAEYNIRLSKRRADAVRAYLVKLGVPDTAIAESWYGKQNPRVPTADGVREAQNRRVEIVIP